MATHISQYLDELKARLIARGEKPEMEIKSIEFTADFKTSLLIPDEGWSIVFAI